jgi:hypothetical protein
MAGVTIAAAPPRRAPVRSRIARALFERAVSRLDRLDRLGRDGKIGFGEAYMAGDWHTADLPDVLLAFANGLTSLIPRRSSACAASTSRHAQPTRQTRRPGRAATSGATTTSRTSCSHCSWTRP